MACVRLIVLALVQEVQAELGRFRILDDEVGGIIELAQTAGTLARIGFLSLLKAQEAALRHQQRLQL